MAAENVLRELGVECPLDLELAASVHLYTQDTPFFVILNALLRDRNRDKLKPFFPYLNLLITALSKLLAKQGSRPRTVYRGVKVDLIAHYPEQSNKVWWGVSSTSAVVVRCSVVAVAVVVVVIVFVAVFVVVFVAAVVVVVVIVVVAIAVFVFVSLSL